MSERQLPRQLLFRQISAIKLQQLRLVVATEHLREMSATTGQAVRLHLDSIRNAGTLLNWYSTPSYTRSDKVKNLKFGIDP